MLRRPTVRVLLLQISKTSTREESKYSAVGFSCKNWQTSLTTWGQPGPNYVQANNFFFIIILFISFSWVCFGSSPKFWTHADLCSTSDLSMEELHSFTSSSNWISGWRSWIWLEGCQLKLEFQISNSCWMQREPQFQEKGTSPVTKSKEVRGQMSKHWYL